MGILGTQTTCQLSLMWEVICINVLNMCNQPSKFEAKWLEEEDCQARVMESWGKAIEEGCRGMMEIQRKILGELWEWDRNILGELEERIKKNQR